MSLASVRRRPLIIIAALTLFLMIVASLLWFWPADTDPQGGEGFWCDNGNIYYVSNSSGWVVSGHNTVCSGFGGNSAIYIYAHPIGQNEGREFLVFRYFEHGGSNLPKIEWIGENKLLIQVDHVSQVTKKISSIGPVSISYQIGKEDYPMAK
jgi:hypothetical protein